MWPFEFRDCYTHDLETGLYKPSRLFDDRMNDIKCWTMGPDFFQRFPELSSDIAASGPQIPRLLSSAAERRKRQVRLPTYAASTKQTQFENMNPMTVAERRGQEQEEEALTQTAASLDIQLRPHLPQSHNYHAHTFPPVHDGYDFQGTGMEPPIFPSDEWHIYSHLDSDSFPMDTTSTDASTSLFMSESASGNEAATLRAPTCAYHHY